MLFKKAILLICFTLIFLVSCRNDDSMIMAPRAADGVMDLTQWDIVKDGPVKLNGTWEFYWRKYLSAVENKSGAGAAPAYIDVPGVWNGYEIGDQEIGGTGFATYRLKVMLPRKYDNLSFKLFDMSSAYRIYADGKMVYAAGSPGQDPGSSKPGYRPGVAVFEPAGTAFDVIIHVSNFHHRRGGCWAPIFLGEPKAIANMREKGVTKSSFIAGMICFMALYHIILFIFRRNDRSTLYLGLFCFTIAVRIITHDERVAIMLFEQLSYYRLMQVICLSLFLCVPPFLLYMRSLFPQEISRCLAIFSVMVSGLFSAVTLFGSVGLFTAIIPWFQVYTALLLIIGVVKMIQVLKNKRPGAIWFIAGFPLILVAAVNDILYSRLLVSTGYMIQYGLLIFLFFQAILISRRFSTAFETVEKQKDDLSREFRRREFVQKTLERSEKKYRNLFENGSDLICIHDLEGIMLETNLPYKEKYGWEADGLIGQNIRDLLSDRQKLQFDDYLSRIIKNGEEEGYVKGFAKSGEPVILEYKNRLIRNKAGRPFAVQGAARDVTERINAERALKKSEEKYRNIVRHAPAGIYEFDLQTLRFTSVNDVMCEYTGYTRQEFLELDPFDLLTEDSRETLTDLFDYVRENRPRERSVEYRIKGKNSQERSVMARARFFYEDGVPKTAMAVVHDLTEIRQAEEKRRELEIQLQQAGKMEAVGKLAGGIAHDFNNILAGILGYCDLALKHVNSPDKAGGHIRSISAGAKRAAHLVKQILTFSRKQELTRENQPIAPIISEAVDLLTPSMPANIEVRSRIESDKKVMSDSSKIHQIVMNLCTNAHHAMRESGGILSVTAEDTILTASDAGKLQIPDGEYIKISVSDTGQGMKSDLLDKIFDPYFTTKDPGKGTGIGLPVVYAIVKEHSGAITVNSVWGMGSEFIIYLPVTETTDTNVREMAEEVPGPAFGSENIMVVDDEDSILGSTKELLEDYGYSVTTFSNGEDALKVFEKDPARTDLVITDMTMPGLTGDKLSQKMLSLKPDLPIVMCTGYNENISKERAGEIGIRKYIEKPLIDQPLARIIRELLDAPLHRAPDLTK